MERDPDILEGNRTVLDGDRDNSHRHERGVTHSTVDFPSEMMDDGEGIDVDDHLPTPPFNHTDFVDSFMPVLNPDNFLAFSTAPSSPRLHAHNLSTSPSVQAMKDCPYGQIRQGFQSPLSAIPFGRSCLSSNGPSRPETAAESNGQRGQDADRAIVEKSQTCDCFAACLQVLQSLHNHSWLLSSTEQGGPPFDVVLTINKEAIESCATLLGCASCVSKSGKSIATMMLATLFGKVMSLYRAACFLRFGTPNNMQSPAQLAFGAYTVTGENRQLLEIEILLLDLRKVGSVLRVYSERFRNAQAEKDDETSVYNALTSYLDKNLRYIVQFLNARKGVVSR